MFSRITQILGGRAVSISNFCGTMLLVTLVVAPLATNAETEGAEVPKYEWSFAGPFGSFDQAQLQRGFKVFQQVCATCHQLGNVAFRNLSDLGYDELEVKAIALEYQIEDGPDEFGDMFFRSGRPSDYFPAPFANPEQARFANSGAFPPDLATIIKARKGGADYVASLLQGYRDPPADGPELGSGQFYNIYFPGNVIAMSEQLFDDFIEYEDGTPQTTAQYAKDVTAFLAWANEPTMIERKQLGAKVILFLLFLLIVCYLYMRRIWGRLAPLK